MSKVQLDDFSEAFRMFVAGLLVTTDVKHAGFWKDTYRSTGRTIIEAMKSSNCTNVEATLTRIVALLGRIVMEKELPEKDFNELQGLMKPILGHYGLAI
jgi:hypothetical protein